jgi:hypothetical protein
MAKTVKLKIDELDIFRRATPKDIFEGNVVYLIGDGSNLHKQVIEEVMNPKDDFKAYVAEDGCRYGLHDLWILKSSNELQSEIQKLKSIINNVIECVGKKKV